MTVALSLVGLACGSEPPRAGEVAGRATAAASLGPSEARPAGQAPSGGVTWLAGSKSLETVFAKRALAAWLEARQATLGADARVELSMPAVFRCANCEDAYVIERSTTKAGCTERHVVLHAYVEGAQSGENDPKGKVVTDEALFATRCCPGTCAEDSPVDALFALQEALEKRDLAKLEARIEPNGALSVEASWSDDQGSRTEKKSFARGALTAKVFDMVQGFDTMHDQLECPAAFDAQGKASCVAQGGGFQAEYVVVRVGKDAMLRSISQRTH